LGRTTFIFVVLAAGSIKFCSILAIVFFGLVGRSIKLRSILALVFFLRLACGFELYYLAFGIDLLVMVCSIS
jgi:hypothetical protein